MDASGSDYTIDVVYPSAFGAFQSPAHLVHAAWMGGRAAARIDQPFAYADLGCGAGLTLCVLADCYPHAEFHGVDINPEHIRQARALARDAGLTNVTFHQASFGDLGQLPIPQLQFVGLSGVYSWLAPGMREACMAFLGERLSDAGAVFLHYAALPGNAQIDALYALIREAAHGFSGDSVERYLQACAMVGRLRAARAQFFLANPQADAWFGRLLGEDPRGMAHEVLNARGASLSARDAADEAAAGGLSFVASAQLELNDLAVTAPDALRDELAAAGRVAREMLMDAFRNAHSRMDVLMRCEAPPATAPPAMWADRLSTGSLREERKKLSDRLGLDLCAAPYDAVLERIDGHPAPLSEILDDPLLVRAGVRAEHVQRLLVLKLLHLLVRPYASARTPGRPRLGSRLNQLVLAERIESSGPVPFASPVAGTQVLLPMKDRLTLLALLGGDFGAAWKRLGSAGSVVKVDGLIIGSPQELERAASDRASVLGGPIVDQLTRLGVLVA